MSSTTCTWLILSVVLLLSLLLFSARSLPFASYFQHSYLRHNASSMAAMTTTLSTAPYASEVNATGATNDGVECHFGKVYIYDLPRVFNADLVENCLDLDPWHSGCQVLSKDGFGLPAAGISKILLENLVGSWFWTDVFTLELIFHNRIANYKCRTTQEEYATTFYISFYAGRICYGFHPTTADDITRWQQYLCTRQRNTLFYFAGAPRRLINNDFRALLLTQYNDSGACRSVDCSGTKCSNGTSEILESFLDSDFCLQPRGDSLTRRSTFDCMVAGSIPIFFWKRSSYYQYMWFFPPKTERYSVFINWDEVKNETLIKYVLEKISKEKVKEMRSKVIDYIPNIIYAKPNAGIEGVRDAFDIAIEGVLRRAN